MDRGRAIAALAGVSGGDEPRNTHPPRPTSGLAPQARNRISDELTDLAPGSSVTPRPHQLRAVLRDALELGCVLAFPVTGIAMLVIGALLLIHEVAGVGVELAPGRTRLEVVGSAVVFGSVGWLLLGIAWELPSGVQIRRSGFRLDTTPARVWRALALIAGILGILGSIQVAVTRPVWPTLSLGGTLWLASGATAVFVVAPVAVLIPWGVRRWWRPSRGAPIFLPLLLVTWAIGTGVVFGWMWR